MINRKGKLQYLTMQIVRIAPDSAYGSSLDFDSLIQSKKSTCLAFELIYQLHRRRMMKTRKIIIVKSRGTLHVSVEIESAASIIFLHRRMSGVVARIEE